MTVDFSNYVDPHQVQRWAAGNTQVVDELQKAGVPVVCVLPAQNRRVGLTILSIVVPSDSETLDKVVGVFRAVDPRVAQSISERGEATIGSHNGMTESGDATFAQLFFLPPLDHAHMARDLPADQPFISHEDFQATYALAYGHEIHYEVDGESLGLHL